jgi:hypothetical protein
VSERAEDREVGIVTRCTSLAVGLVCLIGYVVRADAPPGAPVSTGLLVSSAVPAPVDIEQRAEFERDEFFGEPDEPVRRALMTEEIVSIEKGRGGRSLAFRITLTSGQRGYFKPEQSFSAANWFGEVAAYHLDRLLGLGRVPVVVSRTFPWKGLEPVAGKDPRKSEVIAREGKVFGAFVGWVNGGLRAMEQQEGWERWLRVEHWPTSAVSPFQRPALWQRDQALIRRLGPDWRDEETKARLRTARPEPVRPDRPAELSDLIVFDYLTRNLDRWGGNNANVLIRGAAGPLVFLDNGAGFEPGAWRPDLCEARLNVLQRFRRRTIEAVRALDLKRFEARLATEAIAPVLNRPQLLGLATRQKALLQRVAELEAAFGEAIWVIE